MGNSVTRFVYAALTLLAAVFILVASYSAYADARDHDQAPPRVGIKEKIIQRLCERQEALLGRLKFPLISPELCNAPPEESATLIVKKMVIRNNGGTAATSTFSFQVNGGSATLFEADGQNNLTVAPGTYSVTEIAASGFTTSYNNCSSIPLANGGSATCTITNNDVAVGPTTGHLIVNKVTQPGGNTTVFNITASGSGAIIGGGAGTTTDTADRDYEVTPGTYSVAETIPAGWVQISNTCIGVAVAAGETKNCTIVNGKLPTLTVVKVVINDNGGAKQANDFPLFIDGNQVSSWATTTVATGTRAVSETNQTGYARSFSDDCDSNGNVTLSYGDVKTCTITNNDIAQGAPVVTLVAFPTSVTPGAGTATTTLTWTSTNATTCTASGGTFTGSKAVNSSEIVTPSATTTYALNCTGPGGSGAASTTVNFVPTPPPAPTLTLSANPTSVTPGAGSATSTLSWTSTNTTSCTASDGWGGSKALAGTEIVQPSATTTYSLLCSGAGGSISASTTVNFVPAPPAEGKLLITEVLYDLTTSTSTPQGQETANEWVEVYNGTNSAINFSGWFIGDASTTDALPSVSLPAGKFAFITGSSTTASFYSIPGDVVIIVLANPTIGNGLGNNGDGVRLLNANNGTTTVDSVNWGFETGFFSPSVNPSPTADDFPGQSIGRIDKTVDTNQASDWERKNPPTPGL